MEIEEVLKTYPPRDMPKYYDDRNMVGVIYSPGYGAGFWRLPEQLAYLRRYKPLVEAAEAGRLIGTATELGLEEYFKFGHEQADVYWVPELTSYRITEYDGYESVETSRSIPWSVA